MVRSSPAVAALLVLLMISGRVLTVACEIACSLDAGRPHSEQVADRPPADAGHGCHEAIPAPLAEPDLLWSCAPHSACGHEDDAEPFVVAAKSVLESDLHVAKLPGSTRVEPLTSDRSQNRLREHAPRGGSAPPAAPLRI